MNCNSKISVFDLLDSSIHTRQAASQLLQVVFENPCNYIELDFANVNYISRSFADQFHSDKLVITEKSQKSIIITNANDEVIKMLQAVANTQNKEKRDHEKIPVYNYTEWNSLDRFLLSI